MRNSRLRLSVSLLVLTAAVRGAAVDFDGRLNKGRPDLLSQARGIPLPKEALPVPGPLAPAAPEAWKTEVLHGAVNDLNRRFSAMEAGGFEVRVESCQFARFSVDTVLIRKLKLPEGTRSEVRTESLLGSQFQRRMAELEGQGYEVEIRCFENIPWLFGDHGVIQYRGKPR